MAEEKETEKEEPKVVEEIKQEVEVKAVPSEEVIKTKAEEKAGFDTASWKPKTALGQKVKNGEITHIDQILNLGYRILEPEIVDILLPDFETDLLFIGQSKGKFGGGARRVFRQTQKKTREGNKPRFSALAVVGNKDGYVGLGYGKARETVPGREKAFRNAKLNLMKIRRGCGSWEDTSGEPYTIPFKVEGKCGSVRMVLIPAPKGTGLCIEKECAKVLRLAGITNIWSKTYGQTKTKLNLIYALEKALKQLSMVKVNPTLAEKVGMIESSLKAE